MTGSGSSLSELSTAAATRNSRPAPRVVGMDKPVLFVVAAGPGVSGSVARRFGREGYDAALVGLDETVLEELAASLRDDGIQARWRKADITDAEEFAAAASELGESGRPDRRTALQPERLPAQDAVGADAGGARCGRPCRSRGAADRRTVRAALHGSRWTDHGHRQHGRRQALERGGEPGRAEGRPAQPDPQHRHHPEAGGDPGGLRDRPRHARQGGSVHARTAWPRRSSTRLDRTRRAGGPRSHTRVSSGDTSPRSRVPWLDENRVAPRRDRGGPVTRADCVRGLGERIR